MGISRDSMHKRRATGGKKKAWRKKRKYELGRQPANTKLSSNKTVRRIRVRGGNVKWRALRLDTGNFWMLLLARLVFWMLFTMPQTTSLVAMSASL